jgi:hypothetical protein
MCNSVKVTNWDGGFAEKNPDKSSACASQTDDLLLVWLAWQSRLETLPSSRRPFKNWVGQKKSVPQFPSKIDISIKTVEESRTFQKWIVSMPHQGSFPFRLT